MTSQFISVVCNFDTRPPNDDATEMFNGVRNRELLVAALVNYRRFFQGFDFELLVHIDEHEYLDSCTLNTIRDLADSVCVRRHSKRFAGHEAFQKFNDVSYKDAFAQARGEIIVHFDGDTACFARSPADVQDWLNNLKTNSIVSYPSIHSPDPVVDESFDCFWASTRCLALRRCDLKITEWERCLLDGNYLNEQYGEVKRDLGWLEHILGRMTRSVIYPPMQPDLLMFSWEKYSEGVLTKLNQMSYDAVRDYVVDCGGIGYPNNLNAKPI